MTKTFEIIKKRWQEVALIVGLGLLGSIANFQIFKSPQSYKDINVFGFLVPIILTVFFTLFELGFLRTAHLSNHNVQTPIELLKIGKRFFWRIFAFNFLFSAACLLITMILFTIIGYSTEQPWLNNLLFVAVIAILAKPFLLIPAIIIVTDCKFVQSFQFLKKTKITGSVELLLLFVIFLVLTFSAYFLPDKSDTINERLYVYKAVFFATLVFLKLAMKLSAVRLVGFCNLKTEASINEA